MLPARLLALALVVSALFGPLACSEPPPSIVLWHAYRGDEEKALGQLAREFQARESVRVEVLAIPFEAYAAKLTAAIPHAHGPDLFIDAHERLGSYLKDKLVAPAGDAFPEADRELYAASSVDAVSVNGVRYAVPLATKCVALFVNDELLAKVPQTIEELAALRATLPRDVYPLAYEAESPYFHAPFLHAYGGAMLGPKDEFAFVGKGPAASVELVRDWTKERVLPEEPSGTLVAQLFASGKAAAVISGPWFAADLKGRVRFHVEPLPRVGKTGQPLRPFLTVDGAFLTPTGSARADVRDFARFLASKPAATVRASVGHQVVATNAAWDEPVLRGDRMLAAFHEAAKQAVPMPPSTRMRATWVPAEQAIRKVLRGDLSGDDALNEARARFEDVLKPPPPPPSPAPLAVVVGLILLAGALFSVQRLRDAGFRKELRASVPYYKYVTHAALTVIALVVFPLVAGALTSFFAGPRDNPQYVGFGNYVAILTARGGALLGHGSFYLTLLVTLLWTVCNVALHVGIGVVLGIALSRPFLRLKAAYRVLLILPWAVPSYVTALAWKGMFHRQFGAINALLHAVGAEPISWFSRFTTAFTANLATNVWLGFPFMMVVTLGALTSIPKEVLEAAEVDGATRWQRFWLVTMPLLKPALLPSIVLGSVWTFNMFNVVFLVSGGEPDGTTDILISEAYRWAFTRDSQYGYAAAYAVLIFLLLAFGTRVLNRVAGKEETL